MPYLVDQNGAAVRGAMPRRDFREAATFAQSIVRSGGNVLGNYLTGAANRSGEWCPFGNGEKSATDGF